MDKSSADRADTKTERDGRDEPAWTEVLAGHVTGQFEDNVTDVEDGEHDIIVVSSQVQILLETGKFSIAWGIGRQYNPPFLGRSDAGHSPILARSIKQKR